MKKMQYSAGVKGIVILFEELFSVILVVCLVMLTALLERSMLNLNDLRSKPFYESGYYENLFKDASLEVMYYIRQKEQFETGGIYDPEKVLDIRDFVNISQGTERNRSIVLPVSEAYNLYRLKDLENWSKAYVTLDSVVETNLTLEKNKVMRQLQTVIIADEIIKDSEVTIARFEDLSETIQSEIVDKVQHHYGGNYEIGLFSHGGSGTSTSSEKSDEIQLNSSSSELSEQEKELLTEAIHMVMDGKLYELKQEELWLLLNDLELNSIDGRQESIVLQEDFLPISGESVLDSFLSEKITWEQLLDVNDNLFSTFEIIGEELDVYRKSVSRYQREDTNLKYWYYSENMDFPFTNISEEETGMDLLTFGKKQGSYFYYDEENIQMDTNIYSMEEFYYNNMAGITGGQNRTMLVAVDINFSNHDSFLEAKTEYNNLQPWVMVSLIAAVISLFGFLLCFIYLSISAGRNTKDDEVHLCWFDRIKTEFMLLAFVSVCVGIFMLYAESAAIFDNEEITGLMIMSGGITFSGMGIFLIFYLSIVRRYKAAIMWTGSCIYWLGKETLNIYHNRKLLTRIMFLFGIHTACCLLIGLFLYLNMNQVVTLLIAIILFLILCCLEITYFVRGIIQRNNITYGIKRIASGDLSFEIDTTGLSRENKSLGGAINKIGDGLYRAVDDSVKNERLKTDLITNVSHDIKTPLTSIINYVDLIKREDIKNERVQGYIRILDEKSQRLKHLTEDLVEASKVSSGNIMLQMGHLDLVELAYQTGGEFNEKFEARGLQILTNLPKKPVIILADGRRIWRVIENLYNNVAKYAMKNTRVYIDMDTDADTAFFSIKNISEYPLNINASELTERFIRGDVSRNTEGSGLGLSIASDLTRLMGGTFDIYLDGDLFKVTISFPLGKK